MGTDTLLTADLATVASIAKDVSVISALVAALWGGATRRWVWGHHYQEALAREQWWRDYAINVGEVAEKAVRLAATSGAGAKKR